VKLFLLIKLEKGITFTEGLARKNKIKTTGRASNTTQEKF
jgi:hypothetical protein